MPVESRWRSAAWSTIPSRTPTPRRRAARGGATSPVAARSTWAVALGGLGLQGGGATSTNSVPPQNDRTVGTPEPAGDLRDGGARLQQVDCMSPPSLKLLGASMWSHTRRVHESDLYVYYLCTYQYDVPSSSIRNESEANARTNTAA